MPKQIDIPTCFVCRSSELEIVLNKELGPMTHCGECGFAWLSPLADEEIESTYIQTIAS